MHLRVSPPPAALQHCLCCAPGHRGLARSATAVAAAAAAGASPHDRAGASTHQMAQQQQQQQQQEAPSMPSWSAGETAAFLREGRDWPAVEHWHAQLVAGRRCLSDIGLAPAGQSSSSSWRQQSVQQQSEQQQSEAHQRKQAQHQQAPQRTTYKLLVSYLGSSFSGWLRGNSNARPTVQASLGAAIAAAGLTGEKQVSRKKARRLAGREAQRAHAIAAAAAVAAGGACAGAAAVADAATVPRPQPPRQQQPQPQSPDAAQVPALECGGRTDAGVSAVGQVATFYSWAPPQAAEQLTANINAQLEAAWRAGSWRERSHDGSSDVAHTTQQQQQQQQQLLTCPLRVWQAREVPRSFHPQFAATWRRYVFLLPLRGLQHAQQQQGAASDDAGECQAGEQPAAPDVDVALVHALLQPLVGRALDYHAYARDTPPGKPCECTLSQARALVVALPSGQRQTQCLCVELVGDRFLRRMVRVLVATAVREAVALQLSGGTDVERLVALAAAKDRLLTAVPAPSGGLCLAAVGH